jgi:nucleoside-diphosphate-sugar epimerase
MKLPRILFITGIAGSVGRNLAMLAQRQGWSVSGLALPGEDVASLEAAGIKVSRGSIENEDALRRATGNVTHVVHCAGLLPNVDRAGRAAFQRINVEGARTMCRLTARSGWRRIVFLSTVGVLGRESTGPSTDDTLYREPFDHYTWSKIEAEKTIAAETKRFGIPSLILRPANIYGPNMSFKWPEVFALIKAGKMRLIGDGNVPFSLIHVEDLARAILISLEDSVSLAPGDKITIVSRETLTLREVLTTIASKLSAPPVRSLPRWLTLVAAYALAPLPSTLRFGRLKHLTVAQVQELSKGFLFDSSRAKKLLGFESQMTFQAGIDVAIRQFQGRRDEDASTGR